MAERKSPLGLSVVIPVYNERRAIEELLCRVQAVEVDKEIIVVDNGSTDGTRRCQSLFRVPAATHSFGDR